jgi:hypothetical protein
MRHTSSYLPLWLHRRLLLRRRRSVSLLSVSRSHPPMETAIRRVFNIMFFDMSDGWHLLEPWIGSEILV